MERFLVWHESTLRESRLAHNFVVQRGVRGLVDFVASELSLSEIDSREVEQ